MTVFKPGDPVLVEGIVQQQPEGSPVVLVVFTGPGGAPIPLPVMPETVHPLPTVTAGPEV